MSKTLKRILVVLVVIVLGCTGVLASIASQLPAGQGPRIDVADDLVGVETGGSYAWILKTTNGAVLIDAGMDPDAKALLNALEQMGVSRDRVHTVLLTHAHVDHTGGLAAFPRARVHVGRADLDLLLGERAPDAPFARAFSGLVGTVALPSTPQPVDGGQRVDADGMQARAIAAPGHTRGSVAWVVGDRLFAGDALMNQGGGVGLPPWFIMGDLDAGRASVEAFADVDADVMLDGHAGLTRNADSAIEAFLAPR